MNASEIQMGGKPRVPSVPGAPWTTWRGGGSGKRAWMGYSVQRCSLQPGILYV